MPQPVVVTVVGVGNPYRSDDAVGLLAVAGLAHRYGDDDRVRLAELDGEPVRLVQSWEDAEAVIVIDAVRSGAAAGTIHCVTGDQLDAVAALGPGLGGGHLLGLGEAVELARALQRMPGVLTIYGVEGERFDFGEGLSPAVERALPVVTGHVESELLRCLARTGAQRPSADAGQELAEG